MTSALVLAGGGVAGIAWELGVLRGLADVDPAAADALVAADVVVGTSAGSTVAAQITSSTPLAVLYDAQLAEESAELEVDVDLEELFGRLAQASAAATDPVERRRLIGSAALETRTVPEAARLGAVRTRLPATAWPDRDLRIPVVDAATGELVVLTRGSGVPLDVAVAASCAVPGVWPPVTVGERRYVDGGVRSVTNADLAGRCDTVLVVTPSLPDTPAPWGDLDAELAEAGGRSLVVYADDASVAAFGHNPLSPATRPASARAGREVGRTHADEVRFLLG